MAIHTLEGVARCPACGEPLYADAEHECVISYEEMAKAFIAGEEKIEAAIQRADQAERERDGKFDNAICQYCSARIPLMDTDALSSHWRKCPNHPARQQVVSLEQQVETMRAENKRLTDELEAQTISYRALEKIENLGAEHPDDNNSQAMFRIANQVLSKIDHIGKKGDAVHTLRAYEENQQRALESHGMAERFVWGCDTVDALCDALESAEKQVEALRAALRSIAALGGNLTDERMEKVGGENEGRDRALKFIQARQIARDALAEMAPERKE